MDSASLKNAGFSDEEINEYSNLQAAGFTPEEINTHYSAAPQAASNVPNASIANMSPEELNNLQPHLGQGKATGISTPPPQWKQDVVMGAKEILPSAGMALGGMAAVPAALASSGTLAPALIPLGAGLGKAAGNQGADVLASLLGFKSNKNFGDSAKQAISDTATGATETAAGMAIPGIGAKLTGLKDAMKFPLAEGETSNIGPLSFLKQKTKDITRSAVGNTPEWLIKKAYKPSATLTPPEENEIVGTILKHEIKPSGKGWDKLNQTISGLNSDVDDIVSTATNKMGLVDKRKALDSINILKEKYSGYDTPVFKDALESYEKQVMGMNPETPFLTAQQAHDMKKGIWAQLEGYFGENTQQPVIEGMKRFGSGLREGVESAAKDVNLPGYQQLPKVNAELGRLLDAKDTVGRATGRIGNRNPIGLPAEIGVNVAAHGGAATPVGIGMAVANNPTVKVNTALALNRARNWAGAAEPTIEQQLADLPLSKLKQLLGMQ